MAPDRARQLAELAKRPSPFRHTAAPPPWAPRAPDVPELNAPALSGIAALIQAARAPGAATAGALVLGAAGSGKSHLVHTLHHRLGAEARCTLVEVRPPGDPARPLRHLAALIVATMAYRPPGDRAPAPLARVLAKAVASWLADEEGTSARRAVARRELQINRQWADISGQVSEWLQDQHPELWPPLLEVLIQYPVPARQQRAVQWMRGDALSEAEMKEVGQVPEPGQTQADLESMAGWKIASLTRLLALDRPLVVTFDNLESPAWSERRPALNRMLEFLFQSAHHAVVVGCSRTEGWSTIAADLEPSVRQRFGQRFELGGCARREVEQLIASRLATLPREGVDPAFPFDDPLSRHQLMDLAAGGRPLARDVLRKGRQMWVREVAGQDSEDVEAYLTSWFQERVHLIEDELDRFPPDDSLLLTAITRALEHPDHDLLHCEQLFRPAGKGQEGTLNARLRTRPGTFRYRFIASTKRDPVALAEPIFQAVRHVNDGELDIAVLVRDYRCPMPDYKKWPGGRSPLDALLDAGGYLMEFDLKQLARALAIEDLRAAVAGQELEVVSADGEVIPVAEADLSKFLDGRPPLPQMQASLAACAARMRDRRAKST